MPSAPPTPRPVLNTTLGDSWLAAGLLWVTLTFLLDSRAPVLTPTVTTPTLADGLGDPFRLAGTVTDATTVTLYLDLFIPARQLGGQPILFDQATWSFSRTDGFTEGGTY